MALSLFTGILQDIIGLSVLESGKSVAVTSE